MQGNKKTWVERKWDWEWEGQEGNRRREKKWMEENKGKGRRLPSWVGLFSFLPQRCKNFFNYSVARKFYQRTALLYSPYLLLPSILPSFLPPLLSSLPTFLSVLSVSSVLHYLLRLPFSLYLLLMHFLLISPFLLQPHLLFTSFSSLSLSLCLCVCYENQLYTIFEHSKGTVFSST